MKRVLAFSAFAAVLATIAYVFFFRASDEQKIREQLSRLETAVCLKDGTNAVFYAARVNDELKAILTDDVRVNASEIHALKSGRKELAASGLAVAQRFASMELDFSQIDVKIDDAKRSAQVAATADVTSQAGGESARNRRAVSFLFLNGDEGWRISSVTVWPQSEANPY